MSKLLGYCVRCESVRYKGKVDFAPGTALTPHDFEPVEDQAPAPPSGPATCSLCGGGLRFVREEQIAALSQKAAPQLTPTVTTLFEARHDENIIGMHDIPGGVLIKTTKRILVVHMPSGGSNG